MQVRWTYKLHPNNQQKSLMQEWLVTLRKHRNRCLREREDGYNNNNLKNDSSIAYAYGTFCDSETKVSVLLNIPVTLPQTKDLEALQSIVGIDVGINKLVALSDGSFVKNPRLATNKRLKRRLKLRQRKINRKEKGSNNREKAGKKVAKLHKLLKDKRDAYQWKAAKKIVNTSEAIAHEDLNIQVMKKRCKPKKIKGRFMPNGKSAKRSLNRSISDASWGSLFQKIAWLALKVGKPVVKFNPKNTSRECSNCGYISKDNREGEKFICEECGYSDHADTQAARNGLKRVGLKFVSTRQKNLPADCGKVTLVRYDSAVKGERNQGKNPKSKTKKSEYVQLNLFEPGILEDIV